MDAGTQVRLVSNPERRGILTGKSKEGAGRLHFQVQFPDGIQYVPQDQLELAPHYRENPFDLLEQHKIGYAKDLRKIITHIRLRGRLANLIYSLGITNTDFYAYQFKPLLKLLNGATNGLLIADEVGLGKTIEAGLIWTELRMRYDFRRLLVLCPAVLREKWRIELEKRFGIEAKILDALDTLQTLTDAQQKGIYASFAIIASMQGLRPRKGWDDDNDEETGPSSALCRFLHEQEHEQPLVDVLIIDEAHYLRNPQSKTARLGRLLRSVSDHVILLSATPIHLRSNDLYQLLNLVDEDTFNHQAQFENILSANAPLTFARDRVLKKELTRDDFLEMLNNAMTHPLLAGNRQLQGLIDSPPTQEELQSPELRSRIAHRLDTMNILGHVIARTRKREVTEWRVLREPFSEKIMMTAPEEMFYEKVTHLVREFCAKYDRHEGFLLVTPQLQMCSSMPAALAEWQRKKDDYLRRIREETDFDPESDDSYGPLLLELISKAENLGQVGELRKHDSKFIRLRNILKELLKQNPDEKIIVFSRFRLTLQYLKERLEESSIPNILMMGGKEFDKNKIVREFSQFDGPNVLLSSEVGSEGIDLQFCHIIVNYDLPWNPMKIEQRIGRIDRLGQKSEKISIWNLFYKNTIDGRIYTRLLERLDVFKYALGELEAIIGEEIDKLTYDLLSRELTPEQEEERIEQTAYALENKRQQERDLEENAGQLVAYGDYVLHQIDAARELNRWIDAKDIQLYITDFFSMHYRGSQFRQINDDELLYEIRLTNEAKHDLEQFIKEKRLVDSTTLIRSDPAPVRCYFENKVVHHTRRGEVINQNHPLIRFVSQKIEQDEEYSYPAVAVRLNSKLLPSDIQTGIYVFTVHRWLIKGLQEIEQLHFAATIIDDSTIPISENSAERLILAAAINGMDWLEAPSVIDFEQAVDLVWDECKPLADRAYENYVTDMKNKNADRADVQEKTINRHLQHQLNKLNELVQKQLSAGKDKPAKMNMGKIEKLKNRVERKRLEINSKREIKYSSDLICAGIIKVE